MLETTASSNFRVNVETALIRDTSYCKIGPHTSFITLLDENHESPIDHQILDIQLTIVLSWPYAFISVMRYVVFMFPSFRFSGI